MRLVVVGVQAAAMVHFRADMLREMVQAGHQVVAIAPEDDQGVRESLAAIGVRFLPIRMNRTGNDPLADMRYMIALMKTFRAFRADLVLVYAAKPVVYGSLAARLAGVPARAAMITGVGSALVGGSGWRRKPVALVLRALYAVALRQTQLVFFQNPDDQRLFLRLRLVSGRQRLVGINGSGVNLERFPSTPLPTGAVTFLLVARLIRDKGIVEYVEAARRVCAVHPEARFQILGALDPNPTAISEAELQAWRDEGVIEYLGSTDDVRPVIANAHVCVLPSYYGEGVPRSLLEALAMSRPIVTTDMPGCRETIDDGRNGYLVPARDIDALANAMTLFIDHPGQIESMGRESRLLAAERFDVHDVNRAIMEAMDLYPDVTRSGSTGMGTGPA